MPCPLHLLHLLLACVPAARREQVHHPHHKRTVKLHVTTIVVAQATVMVLIGATRTAEPLQAGMVPVILTVIQKRLQHPALTQTNVNKYAEV